MDRENLAELAAFKVIVEEKGFRRAAAKLALSPSALSHAMRRLETKLGTPLLTRSTRSVAPTEAGVLLLQRIAPALQDIERGRHELAAQQGQLNQTVRINAHRNAAELLLLPRLSELHRQYPGLKIDLSIDDGITDIVGAGFDAGIRSGERVAKDMIAVRISADYSTAVVAAPSYLSKRGTPDMPRDLLAHACIAYRHVTARTIVPWRFQDDAGEVVAEINPALVVDDLSVAISAAKAGLGFCYVIRGSVSPDIERGDLVEVMQGFSVNVAGDYLYFPDRRTVSPALRIVIDLLRV